MSAFRSLALVLFGVQTISASALSESTAEHTALKNIATGIEAFEAEHQRLPSSWEDAGKDWVRPLDEVFRQVLPTRRYAFYSPPLVLKFDGERSLQVLAMTRKPMWETTRKGSTGRTTVLKGPGRYVLHREPDGDFLVQWFDESEVQRLWPSTGQALPVPDHEPERPWVTKARREILLKRIGLGSLAAFVAAWIIRRLLMKRRNEPIEA